MAYIAVNVTTEAAAAGAYPAIHFGKREQKLIKILKTYIDAAALDAAAGAAAAAAGPTLASEILGDYMAFSSLAGAGVTSTGNTVITGSLGTSPTSSVTGFPPGTISGSTHAADSLAASAQTQLTSAVAALAALASTATISGDIGSTTKTPGVYDSTTTLGITGTLTLDAQGNSDAQFVFRLGTALTTAASSVISLVNGAKADNVFFLCGSAATLGASSTFVGNIVAGTAISLGSAATVTGRLWAKTASITLIANVIGPAAGASLPAGSMSLGDSTGVSSEVSLLSTGASQVLGRILTATFTVTIASPGVVTSTANGLANGDEVSLSTTGALPTGLLASTTYYVVSAATNTFSLALTPGGAAINTSGSQSGVHTYSASGLRLRAGSVTLTQLGAGIAPSHVVKFAGKHTTLGGAAAEALTVSGVLSTDILIATLQSVNAAQTLLFSAPTTNTLTFTFSADPSTNTVISYQVLRAAV